MHFVSIQICMFFFNVKSYKHVPIHLSLYNNDSFKTCCNSKDHHIFIASMVHAPIAINLRGSICTVSLYQILLCGHRNVKETTVYQGFCSFSGNGILIHSRKGIILGIIRIYSMRILLGLSRVGILFRILRNPFQDLQNRTLFGDLNLSIPLVKIQYFLSNP